MIIYLHIAAALSLSFGLWLIVCTSLNALNFHRINRRGEKFQLQDYPLVSVIIPARNEENNLPSLLESMIHQSYDNIEILVLDDRSTDKTWEIIEEYALLDKRIKAYKTKEKKYSSHGKINAMLTLIEKAKGKYLLCTDADTIHKEESILNALKIMESQNLDILSGFPRELSSSYFARTIIASMIFSNVCIPHFLFNTLNVSTFAIGIGQFIMMKRSSNDEVGGYEGIKDEICDDISIIKEFMKKKKKYGFTTLSDHVSCRMYSTQKEAFSGIERSLSGVFPPNRLLVLVLLIAVVFLLTVSYSPLLSPLFLIYRRVDLLYLTLLGWSLFIFSWFYAAKTLKFKTSTCLSGVLSITFICAMYLHSIYIRIKGRKFEWKGDLV